MKNIVKALGLASALTVSAATGAAALSTVTLVDTGGPAPQATATVPGQNFIPQLTDAGATTLFSGPLDLIADSNVTLIFSLVGAESGFNNALFYDGVQRIIETANGALGNFTTGVLGGAGNSFAVKVAAGTNVASLLSFLVVNTGDTFDSGDHEFGVFASSAGPLRSFFLGLDDDGASSDDNHDDIVIRVNVVPLPAGAVLLLTALGGMAVLRRRQTAVA